MALTGDAATQKETFDVPVVARGTFLGGGGIGGQERRLTGQIQTSGGRGSGWSGAGRDTG